MSKSTEYNNKFSMPLHNTPQSYNKQKITTIKTTSITTYDK